MKNELERVAMLAARFGQPASGVGIGDDAAVLETAGLAGQGLVWTVDAQVEGTHFRREWLSWEDVGWRSFMAAASDLAAMGALPLGALSSLVLPPTFDDDALAALAEGQAAAARALGTFVIGGNLARGTELSITTTLLGRAATPILRTGARPGDGIYLAGRIGFAATGLAVLMSRAPHGAPAHLAPGDARSQSAPARGWPADAEMYAACVEAWRRPRALVGRSLAGASAAIDVSDGLARDAMQLADASGVTLDFDASAFERPPRFDAEPLARCLHGGEDYALLATSAADLPGFTRIGTVRARGGAPVLVDGAPVDAAGFDHFAAAPQR